MVYMRKEEKIEPWNPLGLVWSSWGPWCSIQGSTSIEKQSEASIHALKVMGNGFPREEGFSLFGADDLDMHRSSHPLLLPDPVSPPPMRGPRYLNPRAQGERVGPHAARGSRCVYGPSFYFGEGERTGRLCDSFHVSYCFFLPPTWVNLTWCIWSGLMG